MLQFTSQTTYTMAPVRSLCYGFLASSVTAENKSSKKLHSKTKPQTEETPMDIDSDNENDVGEKIAERKSWNRKEKAIKLSETFSDQTNKLLKDLQDEKLSFQMKV